MKAPLADELVLCEKVVGIAPDGLKKQAYIGLIK